MKRHILKITYVLAWHLGILRLFYFLNRNRQLVLTYHNVLPDELFDPNLVHLGVSCSLSTFVAQIEAVHRRFAVTTEIGKPGTCMITFDDGYRNNLLAAEELAKRHMTGVFFVPACYFSGERILWVDRLLLWVSYALAGTYTILGNRVRIDTPGSRQALWARLYAALLDDYANKQRLLDELDQIIPFEELRETVGAAIYEQRFVGLDDADLEAMKRQGQKLGCHSWRHDILAKLSEDELDLDFAECRKLKSRYNTRLYSYPFGGPPEISASVIAKCKQQGWDAGFANYPTDNRDRFELGRISLDHLNDKYFIEARLSGFETFLKKAFTVTKVRDFLFKMRCHLLLRLWTRGLYLPPDRRLLERVFIPELAADKNIRRILFVGVAGYCDYRQRFPDAEFTTIDPQVHSEGRINHIQDRLIHLDRYFPAEHFDLIILNGVLGWGLNEMPEIDATLKICHERLRKGGKLLIGLNETGAPARVELNSIEALSLYEPNNLPTMAVTRMDFSHPFDHDFTFAMFKRA